MNEVRECLDILRFGLAEFGSAPVPLSEASGIAGQERSAIKETLNLASSSDHPEVETLKHELNQRIDEALAGMDDPNLIDPAIDALLLAVRAEHAAEIQRLKAQLRGWRDGGSGQPTDEHGCPVADPYPSSELNFIWALGRSAYLESDVLRVMVGRADKASELARQLASAEAALKARDSESMGKWLQHTASRCGCTLTTYERGVDQLSCAEHALPPAPVQADQEGQ